MKTRFRISTILFLIALLATFGFLCYYFDYHILLKGTPNTVSLIFIPLLNLLLFSGIIAIIWLAKTISITQSEIKVNYIFRLKKIEYNRKEIKGFYWDAMPAIVEYKRITFCLHNSHKVRFSDFEVGNFYKVEKYLKSQFKICTNKGNVATTEQVREAYYKSNRIDRSQISEIKFVIIVLWALLGFIFAVQFKTILETSQTSTPQLIIICISLAILFLSIRKFRSENKRSKLNKAAHNKPATDKPG